MFDRMLHRRDGRFDSHGGSESKTTQPGEIGSFFQDTGRHGEQGPRRPSFPQAEIGLPNNPGIIPQDRITPLLMLFIIAWERSGFTINRY